MADEVPFPDQVARAVADAAREEPSAAAIVCGADDTQMHSTDGIVFTCATCAHTIRIEPIEYEPPQ